MRPALSVEGGFEALSSSAVVESIARTARVMVLNMESAILVAELKSWPALLTADYNCKD
jgi:hypothetical protein